MGMNSGMMQGGARPSAMAMQQQMSVPQPLQFMMQLQQISEMVGNAVLILQQSAMGVEALTQACYQLFCMLRRMADKLLDYIDAQVASLQRRAPTAEMEEQRQKKLQVLKGLVGMIFLMVGLRLFKMLRPRQLPLTANNTQQLALRRIENHANHINWPQQFAQNRRQIVPQRPQARRLSGLATIQPKL